MAEAGYTVIYDTGESLHKLLKVIIGTDGTYYATCPYHESERVSLSKRTINYVNPDSRANDPPIELAVLEDDRHRLKLSHHASGFVQFSGHGIVSGQNPDGSPKGLGLRSFPLARPTAGPAFGLTVLNPKAFKTIDSPRKSDVVFRESELFVASEDNGLLIESYYFRPEWRRFVRMRDSIPTITIRHPSGALLELRVCPPPGNGWKSGFIGVDVWTCPIKLGEAESGFVLGSPTGNARYNAAKEFEADALFAAYPASTRAASPMPSSIRPSPS